MIRIGRSRGTRPRREGRLRAPPITPARLPAPAAGRVFRGNFGGASYTTPRPQDPAQADPGERRAQPLGVRPAAACTPRQRRPRPAPSRARASRSRRRTWSWRCLRTEYAKDASTQATTSTTAAATTYDAAAAGRDRRSSTSEQQRRPHHVELLLDRQRPEVLQRRGRVVGGEVVGACRRSGCWRRKTARQTASCDRRHRADELRSASRQHVTTSASVAAGRIRRARRR